MKSKLKISSIFEVVSGVLCSVAADFRFFWSWEERKHRSWYDRANSWHVRTSTISRGIRGEFFWTFTYYWKSAKSSSLISKYRIWLQIFTVVYLETFFIASFLRLRKVRYFYFLEKSKPNISKSDYQVMYRDTNMFRYIRSVSIVLIWDSLVNNNASKTNYNCQFSCFVFTFLCLIS